MAEVTVRLQALDGQWVVAGYDAFPGVVPESVQVASNPAGYDTCTFNLRRDPDLIHPDLSAFTPCEIDEAGVRIWEGRVRETPSTGGDDDVIQVSGQGWQYQLDDDAYERVYVHSRVADYQDLRTFLGADLSACYAGGVVNNDKGTVAITFPNGVQVPANGVVGVMFDLGQYSTAKRVSVDYESSQSSAVPVKVRGSDTDNPLVGISGVDYDEALSWAMNTDASGTRSATFTTARRYISIFLFNNAAAFTPAAANGSGIFIKLTGIRVYRLTGYEVGGQSNLHADDIAVDALGFAPLLSQDVSQVDPNNQISFDIPDFAATEPRTPREMLDAANAFHRWQIKVGRDRQLQFVPQETVPTYVTGNWVSQRPGDASKNSGDEIYNRCIVVGTGPDGQPLRVERYASQQPGVTYEPISSPSFPNPSFNVDLSSWTAGSGGSIARNTTNFDSAPASAEIGHAASNSVRTALSGTFQRGQAYLVSFAARAASAGFAPYLLATFGSGDDISTLVFFPQLGSFSTWTLTWVPRATYTFGVTLTLLVKSTSPNVTALEVDSFVIKSGKLSLVDRRGFVKTKILQASAALPAVAASQLADVFLQSHTKTPFKGSAVFAPGDLREYTTGREVHPRELAQDGVGRLVHFSHIINPDSGAIGRDGQLAAVSYDPDSELATVQIDNQRDNFEALLQRYAVVSGGA